MAIATPALVSLLDIAGYHQDATASLHLYFTSEALEHYSIRFFSYSAEELARELHQRLEETDLRSALAILSRLEAAFRVDYLQRCERRRRKRDKLSKAFWALHRSFGPNVRLEDDIFEAWQQTYPETKRLIGELRGAFKFRHWLAHGRYWIPKLGRKYDYTSVYTLADAVMTSFPFHVG